MSAPGLTRRVTMEATGGEPRSSPLSERKNTPHPKTGVYSPPGALTPPRSAGRDADGYGTDENDSDPEYASGYDSEGNHVQYATKENRTKIGGASKRSKKSSSKPSSKNVSRSNTFQNSYEDGEFHTDSEFDSDVSYEEYRNAEGNMEQSAKGDNRIRTHTEEAIYRREKAERKAARAEKREKKRLEKMVQKALEVDQKLAAQGAVFVSEGTEEPKYRVKKTREGTVEESTGDNRIGTHMPGEIRGDVRQAVAVRH